MDNNFPLTETGIKKYEPLLSKIATSFGFNDDETCNLVQQVYTNANRNNIELKHYSRICICLAKIMVYKCIFIISSKLFSQNTGDYSNPRLLAYYSEYKSSSRASNMPLSYWAASILNNKIGFTEAEISELLNISPIKVKERLNKASLFIKSL